MEGIEQHAQMNTALELHNNFLRLFSLPLAILV